MTIGWALLAKTPALYLQLDFEKAFDWVNFNYIWATLKVIGLKGKFLQLMQDLL